MGVFYRRVVAIHTAADFIFLGHSEWEAATTLREVSRGGWSAAGSASCFGAYLRLKLLASTAA